MQSARLILQVQKLEFLSPGTLHMVTVRFLKELTNCLLSNTQYSRRLRRAFSYQSISSLVCIQYIFYVFIPFIGLDLATRLDQKHIGNLHGNTMILFCWKGGKGRAREEILSQ